MLVYPSSVYFVCGTPVATLGFFTHTNEVLSQARALRRSLGELSVPAPTVLFFM